MARNESLLERPLLWKMSKKDSAASNLISSGEKDDILVANIGDLHENLSFKDEVKNESNILAEQLLDTNYESYISMEQLLNTNVLTLITARTVHLGAAVQGHNA
jgi:hypothetical protein